MSRPILPNDKLLSVWVDPIAGRDDGLALVGKRIRCHFPKHILNDQQQQRRVLEGEVIALVDYWKRKPGKPWKVELLVERDMLQYFSFLTRVDQDVDVTKLANDKARRNYRNELRIRGGKDRVVVKMRLLHPGSKGGHLGGGTTTSNSVQWVIQKRVPAKLFQQNNNNSTSNGIKKRPLQGKQGTIENGESGANGELESLQTQTNGETNQASPVSAKQGPNHTTRLSTGNNNNNTPSRKRPRNTPSSSQAQIRHMGDGNDSVQQQVSNWRWLAGKYFSIDTQNDESNSNHASMEDYAIGTHGLIGEVVKVEQPDAATTTLALVTLNRLFLPQQTKTGRLPHHTKFEVFQCRQQNRVQYVVPIEELIVLGWSVKHGDEESTQDSIVNLFVNYTYDNGIYRSTSASLDRMEHREEEGSECDKAVTCHRCGLPGKRLITCRNLSCLVDDTDAGPRWCLSCVQSCSWPSVKDPDLSPELPCCAGMCDCEHCQSQVTRNLEEAFRTQAKKRRKQAMMKDIESTNKFFGMASLAVSSCNAVDFAVDSESLLDAAKLPLPSSTAIKRVKVKDKGLKKWLRRKAKKAENKKDDSAEITEALAKPEEDLTVFKPTCAREAAFDAQRLMRRPMSFIPSEATDIPRNIREARRKLETDHGDKSSENRAARAKQRRIIKGVSNLSGLGLDMLASRESQLRFGRSGIHNWGVFADSDICVGDLIVEYRGEIIGNIRAEKREKEYERAKIGSDYMFRIDKDTVCDATKLGNVARFINASCDPNCYTKIITVEGNKRIVIYAKKDIREGDELCYDYKFPLEYDPSKRIPCHCGTRNCRGFMNWDKRYVLAPPSPERDTTIEPNGT